MFVIQIFPTAVKVLGKNYCITNPKALGITPPPTHTHTQTNAAVQAIKPLIYSGMHVMSQRGHAL